MAHHWIEDNKYKDKRHDNRLAIKDNQVCLVFFGTVYPKPVTVQLEMTVNDYHNDEKLIYRSKESTGFSFKTESGDDLEIVLSETPSMNRIKSNGQSQSLSEFGKSSDIKVFCGYNKCRSKRRFRPEIFVAV